MDKNKKSVENVAIVSTAAAVFFATLVARQGVRIHLLKHAIAAKEMKYQYTKRLLGRAAESMSTEQVRALIESIDMDEKFFKMTTEL